MSLASAASMVSAPKLCAVPPPNSSRLIDDGTLHYEASIAGFAERYRRGETPQTVNVWWARRPHSAMRSLVFACLCKDRSSEAHSVMNSLSTVSASSPMVISAARAYLSNYHSRPRVLDMFGGGGTIAYEAASLGADVFSIDSNELAVFNQKAILEYPQRVAPSHFLYHVEQSGKRILKKLTALTEDLFPHRKTTFAYFWTYSTKCQECGYQFFLSKRPWLSRKNGRRIALTFSNRHDSQQASISEVSPKYLHHPAWTGRNGTIECPRCKRTAKRRIQDCRDELVAVAQQAPSKGKHFISAYDDAMPSRELLLARESAMLSELKMSLPSSSVPEWSGIVNPSLYGIRTHSDFLNLRQRTVLLCLIHCLDHEFDFLAKSVSVDLARAVVSLLTGLVDQLVDWNCRLSMWIPQNEQVGRAFCGPGIAMLWDYAETDPVSDGPSNLWSKLNRIISGSRAIAGLETPCAVRQAFAQELPFEDKNFEAIVTDPPYYDNVYYNALADFFFAWKRPLIAKISPDLSKNAQTNSSRELVASKFRSGHPVKAHLDYCRELGLAIKEAERVLKDDGVFALLYSHSSLQGWDALVKAYRPTGLRITSVQPLSIERKQRPRAMTSEAVNTCVAFVSHKSIQKKDSEDIETLCKQLSSAVTVLRDSLIKAGWREHDVAIACYSQGVALLSNVSSVFGVETDLDALRRFALVVQESFPTFRVTGRKSL